MALRKNQNFLSATEKKQFTDAVIALKAKAGGSSGNLYDGFVSTHYDNVPYGHFGPAFFAWHREFLIKFEQALQSIKNDQSIALPYWDWSVNQGPPWPFTDDFLGGNGQGSNWQVMDGPFAYSKGKWPLIVRSDTEPYPFLVRQLGTSQQPRRSLPTGPDVSAALQATPYDVAPWSVRSQSGFRNRAEGYIPADGQPHMHSLVHAWVGGSMTSMTSPNDPVFWLHHCYMDKLWSDWMAMHTGPGQAVYLPDGGAEPGHNLRDPMPPWNTPNETIRPEDVLKTWDHGYHYDTDGSLLAGETLYPNQAIYSSGVWGSTRFLIWYDSYGVLNLARAGAPNPIWQSDNTGKANAGGKCTLESDGNLVIYGPDNNTVVWQSGSSSSNRPCYLAVQPQGFVAIYSPGNPKPIWHRP
jgi:tyrosinase